MSLFSYAFCYWCVHAPLHEPATCPFISTEQLDQMLCVGVISGTSLFQTPSLDISA